MTSNATYKSLHHWVLSYVQRRVSSPDEAEDLAQQAITKLLSTLAEGRRVRDMAAFLATTTRNVVIDHYRTSKPTAELKDLPDDRLSVSDPEETRREIAGWMRRTVEGLPEPYRKTLRMTEIENVRYAVVAERCGVTLSAVKSRVRRGRELMRQNLLRCCRFTFDAAGRVIDYEPLRARACGAGRRL
jgi:RNA polymerase sigma-70 factor, ECF subfamily